jgi:uncharacterized protein (DUF1015 family)
METPTASGPQLVLRPFRALRLRESFVGAPVANRVFARPYRSTARRLADWQRQRHLRIEGPQALYVHEYTSSGVSVRGIVGKLDLASSQGAVLPHEAVRLEQVAELAERMRTIELNPAPILLMHRASPSLRTAVDLLTEQRPDVSYTDRASQHHRMWRITDPDDIALLSTLVAPTRAVIADGHHRYAAALELAAQSPGTRWEQTLVMLVDQSDTPLQLGAIHRSVAGLTMETIAAAAITRGDDFRRHPSRHEALAVLERALVLHDGESWASLTPVGQLPVFALHQQLFPAWGVDPDAVEHHHSAGQALARAHDGMAILLPAPTFEQVAAAAEAGQPFPQKATSFQPKPHLGSLMRDLRS